MAKHRRSTQIAHGSQPNEQSTQPQLEPAERGLKHRQLPIHRRRTLLLSAAALAVAGITSVSVAASSQEQAPTPTAAAALGRTNSISSSAAESSAGSANSSSAATSASSSAVAPTPVAAPPLTLPAAIPTHLDVPSIGVSSDLLQLGTNPDGTAQVPPLGKNSQAGWYTGSPTPGQLGPSVIFGHVDSKAYGPGVFFKLGALTPGEQISITRADGTIAVFTIDKVVQYPKDQFPTIDVYGNTDHAALRLVTCGGQFDYSARSYEDNIVAFASLTSTKN